MSGVAAAAHARGVTLVELMVGLAIMALFFTYGANAYSDWIKNSQIRTAADALRDGLALAHTEAIRRDTQVAFTLSGNDWGVAQVNPAVTIQTHANADGSPNASLSASQSSVTFNGLGQVTPAAAVTISVSNPAGGACLAGGGRMRCLNVTVNAGGAVRLCDPALPAANPQSCQAAN